MVGHRGHRRVLRGTRGPLALLIGLLRILRVSRCTLVSTRRKVLRLRLVRGRIFGILLSTRFGLRRVVRL